MTLGMMMMFNISKQTLNVMKHGGLIMFNISKQTLNVNDYQDNTYMLSIVPSNRISDAEDQGYNVVDHITLQA